MPILSPTIILPGMIQLRAVRCQIDVNWTTGHTLFTPISRDTLRVYAGRIICITLRDYTIRNHSSIHDCIIVWITT